MFGLKLRIIVGAVLLPAALMAGQWYARQDIPDKCHRGSAMAYGRYSGTSYAWLMHGAVGNAYDLRRHNITSGAWEPLAQMPQSPTKVGWGGSLAWVVDPYAYPETGWLFALKGNYTREFWRYSPNTNAWTQMEPLPVGVQVYDGGALCFGGFHMDGGLNYAYIYALIGNGSPRFFRYKFPVSPTRAPTLGTWTELPPFYMSLGVRGGGALAWCPMTGMGYAKGLVFAQYGDNSQGLYKYNPAIAPPGGWSFVCLVDYAIGGGGAMTTEQGGDSVWVFPGRSQRQWWVYDARTGIFRYFTSDVEKTWWADQRDGAAICHDGSYLYGELGYNAAATTTFKRFSLSGAGEQGGGGQGGGFDQAPAVTVSCGANEHRFRFGAPFSGSVTMVVYDATGRLETQVTGDASSGLTWGHNGAAPGVYFYSVETASARATGKVLVAR